MRLRRWSATVCGAPTRRHHKPGYLKVRRVPTVETQGRGSVRPRGCGVFRVEVREARNMHLIRRTLLGASAVGLAIAVGIGHADNLALPAGAASVQPQIPQVAAAQAAANWIVTQQAADGSIGGSLSRDGKRHSGSGRRARHRGRPVGVVLHGGQRQLVHQQPSTQNTDGPGQLALLILDAHAMNVDPTNFGGTNLAARMVATEQTSGADAGLFGTEAQLNAFTVGGYVQGLVFTALKAVGQNRQRGGDQLADGTAVPQRGLGPAESGHLLRRVHRGSLERHGAGHELDLSRPPRTGRPGRTDGKRANERPLLPHQRAGRRRRLELLPEFLRAAAGERPPVHRPGDSGSAGHRIVTDGLHLHQFREVARERTACRSW